MSKRLELKTAVHVALGVACSPRCQTLLIPIFQHLRCAVSRLACTRAKTQCARPDGRSKGTHDDSKNMSGTTARQALLHSKVQLLSTHQSWMAVGQLRPALLSHCAAHAAHTRLRQLAGCPHRAARTRCHVRHCAALVRPAVHAVHACGGTCLAEASALWPACQRHCSNIDRVAESWSVPCWFHVKQIMLNCARTGTLPDAVATGCLLAAIEGADGETLPCDASEAAWCMQGPCQLQCVGHSPLVPQSCFRQCCSWLWQQWCRLGLQAPAQSGTRQAQLLHCCIAHTSVSTSTHLKGVTFERGDIAGHRCNKCGCTKTFST